MNERKAEIIIDATTKIVTAMAGDANTRSVVEMIDSISAALSKAYDSCKGENDGDKGA